MTRESFRCPLKDGLVAEVARNMLGGHVSMEAAFQDYCRFATQRQAQLSQMSAATMHGAWGGASASSRGYDSIPPPISPGAFRSETISIKLFHQNLSRISQALGLCEQTLCAHEVSSSHNTPQHAVWKQAASMTGA